MSSPMPRGWVLNTRHWGHFRSWASSARWRRQHFLQSAVPLIPKAGGVYLLCAHADNTAARGTLSLTRRL